MGMAFKVNIDILKVFAPAIRCHGRDHKDWGDYAPPLDRLSLELWRLFRHPWEAAYA